MWVYVLRSSERSPARHYTGRTGDVNARLAAHNQGKCRHTSRWRPWKLIVAMHFPDEAKGREFEAYLKTGSGRAFCRRHF